MHHRTLRDFLQPDDGVHLHSVAFLCGYVYEGRGDPPALRALYQDIHSHDCAPGDTVSAGGRDDGSRSCKAGAVLLSLPEADLLFRTAFASQAGIRRGGLFLGAHCGYSGCHNDDGSIFKNLSGDCAGDRKS